MFSHPIWVFAYPIVAQKIYEEQLFVQKHLCHTRVAQEIFLTSPSSPDFQSYHSPPISFTGVALRMGEGRTGNDKFQMTNAKWDAFSTLPRAGPPAGGLESMMEKTSRRKTTVCG